MDTKRFDRSCVHRRRNAIRDRQTHFLLKIRSHLFEGWKRAKGKPVLRIATEKKAFLFEFPDIHFRETVEETMQPLLSVDSKTPPKFTNDPETLAKHQLLQQSPSVLFSKFGFKSMA